VIADGRHAPGAVLNASERRLVADFAPVMIEKAQIGAQKSPVRFAPRRGFKSTEAEVGGKGASAWKPTF
jgi:hypothetical protein